SSFCAGAGESGLVVTSADPLDGGPWVKAVIAEPAKFTRWFYIPSVEDISCPSASFCAAPVDYSVAASEQPLGGAAEWRHIPTPKSRSVSAISCPTTTFCLGISGTEAIVATGALGGLEEWGSLEPLDLGEGASAVSCSPDLTICAVVD